MKKKLSPYQRIIRAAKRGTGVRLSFDDVLEMYVDHAIHAAAEYDDADNEEQELSTNPSPEQDD